jgi:Patatin-like phospholipase
MGRTGGRHGAQHTEACVSPGRQLFSLARPPRIGKDQLPSQILWIDDFDFRVRKGVVMNKQPSWIALVCTFLSKNLLLLSAGLTGIFVWKMAQIPAAAEVSGLLTAESPTEFLNQVAATARPDALRGLTLDYWLIAGYFVFLTTLTYRTLLRPQRPRLVLSISPFVLFLPLAIGLVDWAENWVLTYALNQTPVTEHVATVAYSLMVTKWLLVLLLGILLVVAAIARKWFPQEEPFSTFAEILAQENAAIDRRTGRVSEKRLGLAISGGGIRSATFALGILKALAGAGLLRRFDYLSTVSGGGYIGSWLSKLAAQNGGIEAAEQRLLAEPEAPEINFLRQYSNFLTPRLGFFSADTWSTVATYLRNFGLNLVIIFAGLSALLLLPRLFAGGLRLGALAQGPTFGWFLVFNALALALVGLVAMGLNLGIERAGARLDRNEDRDLTTQSWVQRLVILPLLGAAALAGPGLNLAPENFLPIFESEILRWIVIAGGGYVFAWVLAALVTKIYQTRVGQPFDRRWWTSIVLWALLAGPISAAGVYAIYLRLNALKSQTDLWHAIVWGPPALLLVFTAVGALHIGLLGRRFGTPPREWMARAGAWLMIYSLVWAGFFAIAVFGPVIVALLDDISKQGLAAGWLGTTLGALFLGRSGGEAPEAEKPGLTSQAKGLFLKIAPYVFFAGLVAALAFGVDVLLSRMKIGGDDSSQAAVEKAWENFIAPSAAAHPVGSLVESLTVMNAGNPVVFEQKLEAQARESGLLDELREKSKSHFALLDAQANSSEPLILALFLTFVTVLFARRVDINSFSMHHYYRDRLVRCYLGASTRRRAETASSFTGFNLSDDLRFADLADRENQPIHIVNTALNLVSGEVLAWQQRKAASFVFTPFAAGSAYENGGAFRPAAEFLSPDEESFVDRLTGERRARRGVSLGTAFAISGAAASPNMGAQSSAALAMMLTIFNVRLGWWVGNPEKDAWRAPGPRFGLWNLIKELFGLTSGKDRYLYLSDGGHFENLAIYELVRRRCRVIVVSDAGCDPKFAFDDLANAIRKCRVDFGIEIDIDVSKIQAQEEPFAIGKIHYPDTTSSPLNVAQGPKAEGHLIYLKPTLTPDFLKAPDLLQYKAADGAFPHQTTADQFFNEDQFESYRSLGERVGASAVEKIAEVMESLSPVRVGSSNVVE